MKSPRLGAHMSVAGGLDKALYRGQKAGCEVIQIFVTGNRQWKTRALAREQIEAFHKAREKTRVTPVAAHSSYLINLASPKPDVRECSFRALLDELKRTEALRIPYLVCHPGAHLGSGEERGIEKISAGLRKLFERAGDTHVTLLLETTAGQGTTLGYRFEHLARIMHSSGMERHLGICIDTCHVFAAGYPLHTETGCRKVLREFDRIIGLESLKLFHLNDSKKNLGSRVDRHEHPGKGRMGLTVFHTLLNDRRFKGHAFLIETPKEKNSSGRDTDDVNLENLRSLIKGKGRT